MIKINLYDKYDNCNDIQPKLTTDIVTRQPFTSSYSPCGSILLLVNYEVYSATFLVFLPECKQTFSDFIGIFPSADVQSASG